MDFSELQEKFAPILKQYWLPILLGVFGIVFLLYGLIVSVIHKPQKGDILSEGSSVVGDSTVAGAKAKESEITLDVEGAVLKPGVYKLPKDARIQDALIAAGGLSEKADREKVAKGLNLATKVLDGGKIYIPVVGDADVSTSGNISSIQNMSGQAGQDSGSATGLININTATSDQLDSLPGVGPVTSAKIISNRPYRSIDELTSKKVISASVFGKIKDKISVN